MRPPLPTMVLLPLGTLLQKGTYRLEQLVRHQGLQLTYEGTHLPSQQTVLINTLNPSRQNPKKIVLHRDAFIQEAQAWQNLKHPSLESIRDIFVDSVLPFLVREKLSGQTWATKAKKQPLPEVEAIAQITQIADGLNQAHQQQLLHRDIQPKNIFIHPQTNHPVLGNWVWQPSALGGSSSLLHAYTAPEVAQGQQTVTTDIYGLAATLYTLVTGKIPIAASQRQHIRLEIRHPDLSQATIVALLRGMAMQPQHRPQSISEWLKLLPKAPSPPVSFPIKSGNIGAASLSSTEAVPQPSAKSTTPESSSLPDSDPSDPEISSPSEELSLAPEAEDLPTASTVPRQEPSQTVSTTRLQPYSVPPRFPYRALLICSVLSGVVGIAFGLLLRFHYQNQFTNPQVPAKAPPVQNEDFLPKPGTTRRQLETLPTPAETPLESPETSPLEEPTVDPQFEQGDIGPDPTLQDPVPLSPVPADPLDPDPVLQTPIESYPDSLAPSPEPSPFDPFAQPDFSTPPPSESPESFQ
ncbi:serine/threonine-protein kinase [Acaryochloris marina]|uniref:serine/threonine-protein kinase n=1 Tax=Acaryochloris marina TaxID=155978 RepID=UPI00059FE3DC|nr:serine/threonine-protein kinase [Acaryochloris marina]BDM79289.1 hypothetical protein AM10699_21570 [Acaryochloris marina MBIC10699]